MDIIPRVLDVLGYDVSKKTKQAKLNSHLSELLKHLDVNVVIDVGANAGQYARRLRKIGYSGRIICYEPLNQMAAVLEKLAHADPDLIFRDMAAGTESTSATINISPDTSWSSLKAFSDYGQTRFSSQHRESVPQDIHIERLDADVPPLIKDIEDPRIFLKLDTQGFDLEAFSGAQKLHEKIVGLQAEVAFLSIYADTPRYAESMATYEAAGFETTGLFPVKRDRKTLRMIEMDCVMRRMPQAAGNGTR